MALYVDTSALVKLVVAEVETEALWSWIHAEAPELVACDLVRTELFRAVGRAAPARAVRARAVLESITLVTVSTSIFEAAARLDPAMLRALDAIHVAAALELGDDLTGFVTYDDRLADAARAHGIAVVAPA